jgi:prepilin-type N-terminal cleavage/methylation domain-containing protein
VRRSAFSLIELMIVIAIIGVVYTLAISKIKAPSEQKEQKPTFTTLKEYLHSFSHDGKSVKLLCTDQCQKCAIYSDGEKLQDFKSFFDASVELYRYDFFQADLPKAHDGCFELSVDGDGVSDQVIIVYKEKVYDYTRYFKPVKVYDSLQELKDAKEKLISEVQ